MALLLSQTARPPFYTSHPAPPLVKGLQGLIRQLHQGLVVESGLRENPAELARARSTLANAAKAHDGECNELLCCRPILYFSQHN
jgi:hypothetical protein